MWAGALPQGLFLTTATRIECFSHAHPAAPHLIPTAQEGRFFTTAADEKTNVQKEELTYQKFYR